MKKRLPSTPKTREYLDSLPKIYAVCCWARFGVAEHYFTGKYTTIDGKSIPLVYDYYDANGTRDEWVLRPITSTTTGFVACWLQDKPYAYMIAKGLNYTIEHVEEK